MIPSFKPPALSPIHSATVLICMADWTTNYRVEYFQVYHLKKKQKKPNHQGEDSVFPRRPAATAKNRTGQGGQEEGTGMAVSSLRLADSRASASVRKGERKMDDDGHEEQFQLGLNR